jgi:hypothetical protein
MGTPATGTMTILWRRLNSPGHESARLVSQGQERLLLGGAVFVHETRPCRLDYRIVCDSAWDTLAATVSGWIGDEEISVDIRVDPQRRWRLNGVDASALDGCHDVDLNFSPSTNLLPIRRLNLKTGGREEIRTAWLRFPSFTLEPLVQVYQRTAPEVYRYENASGKFVAWLKVNETGFVIDYPGLWRAEI